MKKHGTCVHFRGIQHATCAAGVSLVSVRDASQPGPYRWPCLTLRADLKATTTCPSFREPTAEEIAADEAEFKAAMDRMRDNAAKGLCNTCGVKTTSVRQAGHCVYANPCGHRIGQGDAEQVARAMNVAVSR